MKVTLPKSSYARVALGLKRNLASKNVSQSVVRKPVHVLYGGANLFNRDLIPKLGRIAQISFETYCPNPSDLTSIFDISPEIAKTIHGRVKQKLATEPVEDLRVDFEDGYGQRSDSEEDREAVRVGQELATALTAQSLPPFYGIRIKPFDLFNSNRSLRTLDLVLTTLTKTLGVKFLGDFKVTLPKVSDPFQVRSLVGVVKELEKKLKIRLGSIKLELLIETPQAIFNTGGNLTIRKLIDASLGRCESIHFGTYDFSSSVGIPSNAQAPDHFACDLARELMQIALAGTEVCGVDSVINRLPIAPFRGTELTQSETFANRETILKIWRHTFEQINRSLSFGFTRGWDLHPAQLPVRYIAVYNYYRSSFQVEAKRLKNFIDSQGQSTRVGSVFDDAAMAQGMRNFFRTGLSCGALSRAEVEHEGIVL